MRHILKSPIFWGSTAVGLLQGLALFLASQRSFKDSTYAISIVIFWVALGVFADYLMLELNRIAKRVDLWINGDKLKRKELRELGDTLEEIVELINQKEATEGRIVLNGTAEVLKFTGLDLLSLKTTKDDLQSCKKFRGIAVYGPGEWMDPMWFSYLIAQAASLGSKDAKRAFIYDEGIIQSWANQLQAIVETLKLSVPSNVFSTRDVENTLQNYKDYQTLRESLAELYKSINASEVSKNSSLILLMDIIYIEFADGTKKCTWRNPAEGRKPCVLSQGLLGKIDPLIKFCDDVLFDENQITPQI